MLEQVRTRTQLVSPSPRLRLYPCGLGLGLAPNLGGLGFKRCGLRLWSDGLGLGLTVSPVRNVQGKLRLLRATMAKIRERINEITKLVPLCSIQHCNRPVPASLYDTRYILIPTLIPELK